MIITETVTLARDDDQRFDATVARPTQSRGTGLVVLHDMYGANPVFHDLAESYAARGFCTLLPDLFWRSEPSGALPYDTASDTAWRRERDFGHDRATDDLRIATDWLRASPHCTGKVAVLGFCFSGRLAFLTAARLRIDAAIAFYGLGIARHLGEIANLACPVQLHYGLNDEHVPGDEIDAVAAAAAGNENVEVHLYPGAGHSFFNPVRPTFDASAAELAGRRIDAFLGCLT
jgi:carboxymethylenebutenolidase